MLVVLCKKLYGAAIYHDVLRYERDHHNPKEVSDGKTTKWARIREVKHCGKRDQETAEGRQSDLIGTKSARRIGSRDRHRADGP